MKTENNNLLAVVIEPLAAPQIKEIGSELKDLQELVGGTIQAVYPYEDPVAIICNDEGKLIDLPLNRALRDDHGNPYDIVAGTFAIVGLGEEDFESLSDSLAQKYADLFQTPEQFVQFGGHIAVLPVPTEAEADMELTL